MLPILSLLVVVALSLTLTRIATVALVAEQERVSGEERSTAGR